MLFITIKLERLTFILISSSWFNIRNSFLRQAYLNKTKLEEEAYKRTTEQQHRIENSDLWKKTSKIKIIYNNFKFCRFFKNNKLSMIFHKS